MALSALNPWPREEWSVTASLRSLTAKSLGEIEVPVPPARDLDAVARLVEASEAAYTESVRAARLRRGAMRDSVVQEITRRIATAT